MNDNKFTDIISFKSRWDWLIKVSAIFIIIFVSAIVLIMATFLFKIFVYLGVLLNTQNSTLYGIAFMSLTLIVGYLLSRYIRIRKQSKYLPIKNTNMCHEQYRYILDRLSEVIELYECKLYDSSNNYTKEISKRFKWTIDNDRASIEKRNMDKSKKKLQQLYAVKEKLLSYSLASITKEDIELLNHMLDLRNYKISIAWWRM